MLTLNDSESFEPSDLSRLSSDQLQIIILKCPYVNWQNPRVPELFAKMVGLKLSGYQNKHRFGVMPVDSTDFVADHLLVCHRRADGVLFPLLGSKSLVRDICPAFHLDFTVEAFFRKGGHQQHLNCLDRIVGNCEKQGRRISYFSSWTILPEARSDRLLLKLLKELYAAATVLHHQEQGISDLLGLGLPKFQTDEFFFSWGFEHVKEELRPTDRIVLPHFSNVEAVFMHLRQFSAFAESLATKHRGLWDSRLVLGGTIRDLELEKVKLPRTA